MNTSEAILSADERNLSPVEETPFLTGLRSSTPIAVSFLFSFAAFGATCHGSGFDFSQSMAMTALLFAGPAQYAIASLLSSGSSLTPILISITIINFRFFLMACQLVKAFRGVSRWKVFFSLPMLSASTFAVSQSGDAVAESPQSSFKRYLGVCLGSYPVAVLSTGIGFGGSALFPPAIFKSIPAITPIYFAIIFAKEWPKRRPVYCGLAAILGTPLAHKLSHAWGSLVLVLAIAWIFSAIPTKKRG